MEDYRYLLKGDKLSVSLDIEKISPSEKFLNVFCKLEFFGKYDPLFLRLSKDVVSRDLSNVIYDSVQSYVHDYLSSPPEEVSGDV